MPVIQTRRRFLTTAALAGAAGILTPRRARAAEPALETTTVRLGRLPVICFAPQYVCEALLRAEGFTDVRYVDTTPRAELEGLGHGKYDFQSGYPPGHAIAIDRELPITVVTGVHAGCFELFAHGGIRSIADLKGKSVGHGGFFELISMMAAYVGLDPKRTSPWSTTLRPNPLTCLSRASSTRIWRFRPKCRNCTRARSAT
jgi:NitT/TauT family transport system substrate-binding protein